jgi:hypothetical protein
MAPFDSALVAMLAGMVLAGLTAMMGRVMFGGGLVVTDYSWNGNTEVIRTSSYLEVELGIP